MTDPSRNPGSSEVSGNAFKGPTGAQTGSGNTQINHYSTPSASPGGSGRGARITILVTAALFATGVIGLGATNIVRNSGGHTQSAKTGETRQPKASQASKSSPSPTREPSPSPTGKPTRTPPAEPEPDRPVAAPSGVPPKPGSITPEDEDLCVDVKGNREANDQKVQLWDCNPTRGQSWRYQSHAFVTFSNHCLDVLNEGQENGTLVQLFECTWRDAQKWDWTDQGKLLNRNSKLCLGYPLGITGREKQLRIYNCNREEARVWTHH